MNILYDQIYSRLYQIVNNYQQTKNINLFIPYYRDKNDNRNNEIKLCMLLNTHNKLFNKIYILSECDDQLDFIKTTDRINIIKTQRPMFNDVFKYSNTLTSDDTINILINTDIVIGEQFDNITLDNKQMLCLSRYDVIGDNMYKINVGGGSHDCWIWKGKIDETLGEFYMGKMLCDGVLANQLTQRNYLLKNPIYDMKIYHIHLTNIRNYTRVDCIRGHRTGVKFSKNDGIFTDDDIYWDGCNR